VNSCTQRIIEDAQRLDEDREAMRQERNAAEARAEKAEAAVARLRRTMVSRSGWWKCVLCGLEYLGLGTACECPQCERDAARAEVARLRAQAPSEELLERARTSLRCIENEIKLGKNGQFGWIHTQHIRDLLAALDEEPEAAPDLLETTVLAECDARQAAAPGTAEWAESAPLDEVRGWLDERGLLAEWVSGRGYHGAELFDRDLRYLMFRVEADTRTAALRALAAQVAAKGSERNGSTEQG